MAENVQVADYMDKLEHPLKREIEEIRVIVKGAEPSLTEHIKWNAPSFQYKQEDRMTFNLQGKGFVRLVFHCGAKSAKGRSLRASVEDPAGLLEWAADDRAIVRLHDMEDVKAKAEPLAALVAMWLKAADE